MKVYKDKQFLIFDFENGTNVKYDFATEKAIGKRGNQVKNLCSQLRGLSVKDLIECCTDSNYSKFLCFVRDNGSRNKDYPIENIGTILSKVPKFEKFEQIFSAGIENIDSKFSYSINDIPKALIKLCKTHKIYLSDLFLEFYRKNPDGYLLAYNLEYTSLTDTDIGNILTVYETTWTDGFHSVIRTSRFNSLIKDYGYTAKALLNYIDYLETYEAITDIGYLMRELLDYARMMKAISPNFDKYPRHFLTTHKIACRNYNRLKRTFDEREFKKCINKSLEHTFGDYIFLYPKSVQDIKDEAVSQNNCVASYIDRVINRKCDILFLRKKDNPTKSLVTIEVRNGTIVQAKQRFNDPVTTEQQWAIDKWNDWYLRKTV